MEVLSGGDCCHVQPIDIDIDVEEKVNETDCDIVSEVAPDVARHTRFFTQLMFSIGEKGEMDPW